MDFTYTQDGFITHVEATTTRGEDFVDAWNEAGMVVVDVGRIILPTDSMAQFIEQAKAAGLDA